jgi:hypothetical protein
MTENPEVAARIALSIRRDGPDIVVWTTLTAEEWKWLVRREVEAVVEMFSIEDGRPRYADGYPSVTDEP